LDFDGLLREPEERLATVPDFLVEEVRLDAAAARFVAGLAELRDFEAELRAEDFTAPRLALRAGDFLADERAEDRFEADAVERDAVFLAEDFAAVFRAVDFAAVFRAVDLAAVFLAVAFLAPDFEVDFDAVFLAEDLTADFLALDLAEDFAAVFLAAVFVPAFLAAVFLAAVERDEEVVDFAALLRDEEAPLFLAPDLAGAFAPFFALVELRRALLFFADFLVLVAPVSPVNSCVSGFDLSSVGIAASFKGLRVQPSRLQGNVVIPRGFRLTESVESRTRTFSVDTFACRHACTCPSEGASKAFDAT
jgi:hypothetical protein